MLTPKTDEKDNDFPGIHRYPRKAGPGLERKSGPTTLVANLQLNGISGFGSESVHFDSPNLSHTHAVAWRSQGITNLTRMP